MKVAAANQMQAAAHVAEDVEKATSYVNRAQEHANRQAHFVWCFVSVSVDKV